MARSLLLSSQPSAGGGGVSISWDDDTVADGNALASHADWDLVYVQVAPNGVPTSDRHDDHNPNSDQVADMSTEGVAVTLHTTELDSIYHQVETEVWPDDTAGNGMGLVLRQGVLTSTSADLDCYVVDVSGADAASNEFYARIFRVVGGTFSLIATSATPVGPAHGDLVDCFGLRARITDGQGYPFITVWVQVSNGGDWVQELTHLDLHASAILTGKYVGRFFDRESTSPREQPFCRDFYATTSW